jgi:hypothetical protein
MLTSNRPLLQNIWRYEFEACFEGVWDGYCMVIKELGIDNIAGALEM